VGNRKPRWRATRRREMKAQGVTPPNRLRVWSVRISELLDMPDWVSRFAIQGLGTLPRQVWLRPWKAKLLLTLDRAAGGRSEYSKTEFRRCELCARPLIGTEAEARRRLLESCPKARTTPCGPNCLRDREIGLWKKLAPRSRRRGFVPKGAT
jgi:hypothetical protein